MSRSIAAKFIVFVLAACTLVAAVASLAGIAVIGYCGLYDTTLEEQCQSVLEDNGLVIARRCAQFYASEQLGECSDELLQELYGDLPFDAEGTWNVVLKQDDQVLMSVTGLPEQATRFEYTVSVEYASVIPPQDAAAENAEGDNSLYYYDSPEYTVVIQLSPEAVFGSEWALLELLYSSRYQLIVIAAASLLLFAACFVYLCCVAGRTPGSNEIHPGGLNRLPLDLYAVIIGSLGLLVCLVGIELFEIGYSDSLNNSILILSAMVAVVLSLLLMAYLFALVAQLKARHGFWWRNSLIGRCLLLIYRFLRWGLRFLRLIPVMWQWLLTAAVMAGSLGFAFLLATRNSYFRLDGLFTLFFLFIAALCTSIICYGGYAFGTLLKGVRRMNRGDLNHKIPTKYLIGSFRDFAVSLNRLSESAMVAAQKQLKSERMKTELITNVSHDIKTPLTSIINYVDLLQRPHSDEEGQKYLEVLSRQSLRLKKLIDDLMEMSKASTGNLTVDIAPIDAAEAVNQALGEFSGKLAATRLVAVFTAPEDPAIMLADGRLVWRVLSNLLSNAVKYALPGTRVYIDTARVDGQVLISIKNISKEQLGTSAEELMERFVRGDASRNTEGSGLGLNIAKSLMEVQNGQLTLLVDGDLFKVTLFFPAA